LSERLVGVLSPFAPQYHHTPLFGYKETIPRPGRTIERGRTKDAMSALL